MKLSQTNKSIISCVILIIIYILLLWVLPKQSRDILGQVENELNYKLILFLVAIPIMSVWLIAFWGYSQLYIFSNKIKNSSEGEYYNGLSKGIAWLAWSLPVTAIINQILRYIEDYHTHHQSTYIIIGNYINLLLPLISFCIIGYYSNIFFYKKKIGLSQIWLRVLIVFYIIAGVIYCSLMLNKLNLVSLSSSKNIFYLPAWILVLTVLVPYIFGWYLGLSSSIKLIEYSSNMAGVIYRKYLTLLAIGLITVITGFFSVQFLSTLYPVRGTFDVSLVHMLNIVFKVVIGIGFIILAYGANKLKQIEEI